MIKDLLIAALGATLIIRSGLFTFQDTAQLVLTATMLPMMIFVLLAELDGMIQDIRRDKHAGV